MKKPPTRQRKLGLLSVTENKATDSLVVQLLNTLIFLMQGGKNIPFYGCLRFFFLGLLVSFWDKIAVSNCQSLLYIYIEPRDCIYKHFVETKTVFRGLENLLYSLWDKNHKNLNKVWLISTVVVTRLGVEKCTWFSVNKQVVEGIWKAENMLLSIKLC